MESMSWVRAVSTRSNWVCMISFMLFVCSFLSVVFMDSSRAWGCY